MKFLYFIFILFAVYGAFTAHLVGAVLSLLNALLVRYADKKFAKQTLNDS